MTGEVLAALALAIAALWLVLQPLLQKPSTQAPAVEPVDPDETAKGIALAALKEIEFDRETGKLSDTDYEFLKARYTAVALDALRGEQAGSAPGDIEALIAVKVRSLRSASASTLPGATSVVCPACGPRPEPDAVFCSTCGGRLSTPEACGRCQAPLLPGSRFCEACGRPVAA